MSSIILIVAIVVCIIFSAFFSASEMAYSSCNVMRLSNLAQEGNKKAKKAYDITQHFDDALSTILIGNNLVNILSSSLATVLVIVVFGDDSYSWLATAILTLTVIIFGETIPKIVSKANANRFALFAANLNHFLMTILKPLVWLVVLLVKLLTFWMKGEDNKEDEGTEELRSIIETAEDEAVLDAKQSQLLQATIGFIDIPVSEVMTARVDVEAIDIEDEREDILRQLNESKYSRLPVYEGSIDNIIGVLTLNHFLKNALDKEDVALRSLLMKPCYVYKTLKLPDVLNQLKKNKQHLAIVTDEFGGTLGVVSMEDVMEEIVGEIWDETDEVEAEIIYRQENEYEVDGDLTLSEFCELLEIDEETLEAQSETVGGWVIELFNNYPKVNEHLEYHNLYIKVLEVTERRVEKVYIKKMD